MAFPGANAMSQKGRGNPSATLGRCKSCWSITQTPALCILFFPPKKTLVGFLIDVSVLFSNPGCDMDVLDPSCAI